ncbi:MAG: hypothetical protein Q9162_001496 [Coniocarpon cinnabarinum]
MSDLPKAPVGSSWSDNNFDPTGTQPSPARPLGNPGWDDTHNSQGGPNYLRYLTEVYNTTTTLLYDLARAGATIDNDVVNGGVPDLIDQVGQSFTPQYSELKDRDWRSDNTIFNVWMADNDVYRGYNESDYDTLVDNLMHSYWDVAIAQLYRQGARKFLFVNVPAQERSPLVAVEGPHMDIDKYLALKWKFNDALAERIQKFQWEHGDEVQTAFFNSSAWLNPILDHPQQYGFNENSLCLPPAQGCIWNNDFHLVPDAHKLMAEAMLEPLKTIGF